MTTCATYVARPQFQLTPPTPTGGEDCTAYSTGVVIDAATCGAQRPTGRQVRLASNEPVPDPASPGLNLGQAATVASKYGVALDVRIGSRAVAWTEYERRRTAGQPAIIQVGYGPIADSLYDAGRGFRGGHALAETVHATYDPLADGRAAGVFRFDGTVYDRDVIRRAASRLSLGTRGGQPVYPPAGFVWAAFAPDVVPDYRAVIHPLAGQRYRAFDVYTVRNGVITAAVTNRTGGMSATCSAPLLIPDRRPGRTGSRYLVRLTSGGRTGQWVSAAWSSQA